MVRFDHDVVNVAGHNLAWMVGNTYLAWVAVFVATAIDRADARARPATLLLVLVLGGAGGAAFRLRDADPWKAVLAVALLGSCSTGRTSPGAGASTSWRR